MTNDKYYRFSVVSSLPLSMVLMFRSFSMHVMFLSNCLMKFESLPCKGCVLMVLTYGDSSKSLSLLQPRQVWRNVKMEKKKLHLKTSKIFDEISIRICVVVCMCFTLFDLMYFG